MNEFLQWTLILGSGVLIIILFAHQSWIHDKLIDTQEAFWSMQKPKKPPKPEEE